MKVQLTRIGHEQHRLLKKLIADMEKRLKRPVSSVDALEKVFTEWLEMRAK
jgi:hypothetical protein